MTRFVTTLAVLLLFNAPLTAQLPRYSISHSVSSDASQVPLLILFDSAAGVEAAIAPEKGGELSGLKVKHDGDWMETIYLARDYAPQQGWTGKAPLLWPATGRNFPPDLIAKRKAGEKFDGGAWIFNDKRYPMPIHGFARDFAWKLESMRATDDDARVRLSLTDNEQTRESYPFGFRLGVEYVLRNGETHINYSVEADDENRSTMPFSIGNHITFVSPLVTGSDPAKMQMTTASTTELLKTGYGVPTGKSRPRSHAAPVELGGFERMSAVSLTGYGQEPSLTYADPKGLAIRMSHTASQTPEQPVILFNVWGDAVGGFFSPEPWIGLQNSLVLDQGVIRLPAGNEFTWSIRIAMVRD